jgi:hypothetical protein
MCRSAKHRAGLIGRGVAGPDDVTVGTHTGEVPLVGSAPIAVGSLMTFGGTLRDLSACSNAEMVPAWARGQDIRPRAVIPGFPRR